MYTEFVYFHFDSIEFHSEYQKKFRPFSQYDYIAGKFLARDMKVTPSSNLATESWYAEVIELRKKAGEYKVSIVTQCTIFGRIYR